jgi:hypothetical protein
MGLGNISSAARSSNVTLSELASGKPAVTLQNKAISSGTKISGTNSKSAVNSNPLLSDNSYAAPNKRISSTTSYKEAFGTVISSAKQIAADDRASGVGISAGLSKLKVRTDQNVFAEALQLVLEHTGNEAARGTSPGDALTSLGAAAQQYVITDAKQAVFDALGISSTENIERGVGTILESVGFGSAGSVKGVSAAGEATNIAAKAAAGEAGGVSALSTSASALGMVSTAFSVYSLIKDWGKSSPQSGAIHGAATGAYIGTQIMPGLGTAIGAGIGAIAGGLIGAIKTGKHKDQVARDKVRELLLKAGVVDKSYSLQLADGSLYDIGKDGGFKLVNADGTKRRAYEVDFTNKLVPQVIGWAQPLAAVLCGGDPKLTTDFTGYFVNAATSNAADLDSAKKNVLAIAAQLGFSEEQMASGLADLHSAGRLNDGQLAAYANGYLTLISTDSEVADVDGDVQAAA